ncbi:MAG: hypothetical protein A2X80_08915 [Geobacteraceae bacterium GWB2_52_12]|nr:MAG: hypothetical protein A2X80_08915 [Geobacteraceae bacterium GWB2_52_12]
MGPLRINVMYIGMIAIFAVFGCSKEPQAPSATPPAKPLVEIVHDAVKFYASGGETFTAPVGVVVNSGTTKGKDGTDSIVIIGVQQKGNSLASITATFPETWFSSDKQKLAGLEAEIKALTDCANKLSKEDLKNPQCRMEEVTIDAMPGITIRADKAPHITMTMVADQ